MKTINYTGSSKLISRIVNLLNRKVPLPLDGDGNPDWGSNGQVLSTNGVDGATWVNQGGGGSGGHTIEDTSGTDLPQEDNLQFVGVYTRDDSVNRRTEVNIVRQMTKAAMEALSSAEQEGFIDTTDEDDDYIPISAEDVKYGNTDVESELDSINAQISGSFFAPTTFTNTSFTPTVGGTKTLYTNSTGHSQIVHCSVTVVISGLTALISLKKNSNATLAYTSWSESSSTKHIVTLTAFANLANGDTIGFDTASGVTFGTCTVSLAY